MSTALIVVIVVAALILLALLFMLPRMRATADRKKAERELQSRRSAAADEHRGLAAERERGAEMAEQKARMAQQAAERERAEANLQSERAQMHERGMADDQLIQDDERSRFEGVANQPTDPVDRDADGQTMDDRARAAMDREDDAAATASTDRDAAAAAPTDRDADGHTLDDRARAATDRDETQGTSDYEQGREDQRRFDRERITDDVRESERQRP
jgi:hypothetical protein